MLLTVGAAISILGTNSNTMLIGPRYAVALVLVASATLANLVSAGIALLIGAEIYRFYRRDEAKADS